MASSIPVLNNNQMQRFRELLGQGRKIDLTNKLAAKNQRLPTMQETPEIVLGSSSYDGPFAVHKVGEVMVEISSGEIVPSESGTVSAALVTVKNGIITVGDSSWWTSAGPADASGLAIPLPENYTMYLVNSFTSESANQYYSNTYSFQALTEDPETHPNVAYTRLAKNEGGVVKQIQFGDITDAPQPKGVTGIKTDIVDDLPSVILTGGTGAVKFEGDGTVQVSLKARRYATPEEIEEWGRRYNPETGQMDGDYKNAGWRGIIALENGSVMTEYGVSSEIDGVEIAYPLIVPTTTDAELETIAQAIIQEDDSLITQTIQDKAFDWALDRIAEDLSPFYNGDPSDEQYRVVEDDTIVIKGSTQGGGGGGEVGTVTRSIHTSWGAFLLSEYSENYVYCPKSEDESDDLSSTVCQYDFGVDSASAIADIEAALGGSTVSNPSDFCDDKGNIILILPQNPTSLMSVEVTIEYDSTWTVVVTDGQYKIVDARGNAQGTANGYYTAQMEAGQHVLFAFLTSISGWPAKFLRPWRNQDVIAACIEDDDGCWVRIDLT